MINLKQNLPPRRQDAKYGKTQKCFSIFLAFWRLGGSIFLFLLILGPLGADESISLKYTYKPDQTQVTLLKDKQGKIYLPLMDLARFYGVQVDFDSQKRRATLSKGKSQVKLVLSQAIFLTVNPSASFPIDPMEVVEGQLSVSPAAAEDLLGALLNINVRYLQDQQALAVGGVRDEELKEEIIAQEQPKAIPSALPAARTVVVAQASTAVPSLIPTPVEAVDASTEGQPEQPSQSDEPMPSDKQFYRVQRIIIDPGHGGRDVGAKGYDREYFEKQATLDIAKRVTDILREQKDLEVLMTRKADYYITLKYRTVFANSHNGDLFVSIHCNSNPRNLVAGTETYIYSARPSNDLAAVVAANENEGKGDIVSWLAELHHQKYDTLSYELAKQVDDRIRLRLNQHIRRVQHAPFYVLRQVDMPSVLIETAFISNKKEEAKLKDPNWQDKIARAIVDGILAYRDRVRGLGDSAKAQ